MASCFAFLNEDFPDLANMGALAEGYLYSDPNSCLYKMGILAETLVNYMFEIEKIKPAPSDNTQANRTQTLLRLGYIPKEISKILDSIRKSRNEAVHAGYDCVEQCKTLLQMTHTLSIWFTRIYGSDPNFEPGVFVLPEDMRGRADYQQLLAENERMLAELEKMQLSLSARLTRRTDAKERRRNAEEATRRIRFSEREKQYLEKEQTQCSCLKDENPVIKKADRYKDVLIITLIAIIVVLLIAFAYRVIFC